MVLCLCNGLTDTRIEQAISQGARRPRDVQASCGCRAQCGRCTGSILGVIRDAAQPLSAKQDR